MSTVERLYEEVMALTDEERESFIALLWSTPPAPTEEWKAVWVEECKRRLDEIESGAELIPGELVHERMWARVRAAQD
ncbi:MAG TPA: addiction module protein [Tepidiformaceae bacterium]|nr:addiction module protein [Tepidiformaceae bacterium]HMO95811.1 addiction module protein [Tepidiformaceae bacterium]